jgi:hypothetical protein
MRSDGYARAGVRAPTGLDLNLDCMYPDVKNRGTAITGYRRNRRLCVQLGIKNEYTRAGASTIIHPRSLLEPWKGLCLRDT